MSKKLIVFDVDGVLLDNKLGGFKDILVLLEKRKEVKEIEKEWQKRKFSGPWGLEKLAKLYQGISEKKLEKITIEYCREHLMNGVKECLVKLKTRNYIIGALSSNPQFILDALTEILPLDFAEGTKLEFKNKKATGKIKKEANRYIKDRILKVKIKKYKLKKENVIVVGDSITDLPMAKEAGTFIAFLPKEKEVEKIADFVIKKKDLRKILKYI
jgi:HAD superfamily phosphoserine phosphatase-like hydrolase